MKIRAHKLKNRNFGKEWSDRVEDKLNYKDLKSDRRWRQDWISFDGVVYHQAAKRVYCGITSFAADIFKIFECRTAKFIDTDFARIANPYDAKFHRSMQLTRDGRALYTASALLHDVDNYWDAPGGGIFRHDIQKGKTTRLGIPLPHNYIQSIALDEKRGVIYSMHFTPERLSVFDLATKKARDLGPIGSGMAMGQGENILLDDAGNAWCGWNVTRAWQSLSGVDSHRLCRYNPKKGRIEFFSTGLPRGDGSRGTAKVEGLFNLGTGCLYASGGNGSLYRIDPKTARAKYLGTPIPDRRSRLTSLAMHADGWAYGITGRDGRCQLLRFNPQDDRYELGPAIVTEDGVAMWQAHDVTMTPDGILYAGENDHLHRSSYLWEIQL
jgi:hypothetical protein